MKNHSPRAERSSKRSWQVAFAVVLAMLVAPVSLRAQPTAPAVKAASQPVEQTAPASQAMRTATVAWLALLDPSQRREAVFPFGSEIRTDWHFVPKPRRGIALGAMTPSQRAAAEVLLRTVLSERGWNKVAAIRSLELVLREIEAERPGVESIRDPDRYWIAVFGDPAAADDQAWGWRIEGHHISLNFTSVETAPTVVATPLFLGASPAQVEGDPPQGRRALGAEDDLGCAVMASLDAEQQALATIADIAPADVFGVPGAPPAVEGPLGLSVQAMTLEQRGRVNQLVETFARLLKPELASQLLEQIETAGFERLYFAWAGGASVAEDRLTDNRHYFRVHGPTFVLEYDFVEANHVHAVWHSTDDDFGQQTLRRHYREDH
ncbi:DUF3500 domain-containing protein [Botrimarina hoheduenensis]|uniref:DUF3500 domain-containing protein n=1 Tax=Botrimarina hoheduenensis TaxID=2528000 RepID=A0A5C5VVZ2_9BACT|nr:DUF3500 domain-containing protein [Botrimarina hoheduenensis]TWT42754.1 hypothetical protein Pla111_27270 [Botrimarina hoheduenensis]